jgi:hypothetical protein
MTHRTAKAKLIYMLQSTVTAQLEQLKFQRNFTLHASPIWLKTLALDVTSHHHNHKTSINQHRLAMVVGTSSYLSLVTAIFALSAI